MIVSPPALYHSFLLVCGSCGDSYELIVSPLKNICTSFMHKKKNNLECPLNIISIFPYSNSSSCKNMSFLGYVQQGFGKVKWKGNRLQIIFVHVLRFEGIICFLGLFWLFENKSFSSCFFCFKYILDFFVFHIQKKKKYIYHIIPFLDRSTKKNL